MGGQAEQLEQLIRFYLGLAPDDRGRLLKEIQRWPDEKLEVTRDYIQWLFPLPERRGYNPNAPILDVATIRPFRSSPELQTSLRVSFLRMLLFYGFELVGADTPRVVPSPFFDLPAENWLTSANHNHLRITRILKSLGFSGLRMRLRRSSAASRHPRTQSKVFPPDSLFPTSPE